MESNKGKDELSSLGRHIHLSPLVEQFHQEQAHFHMLPIAVKRIEINQMIISIWGTLYTSKQTHKIKQYKQIEQKKKNKNKINLI